jgi:NAD(P)-dependent dehydrogenase (short-subunit alcohol dehydrogenase family)
MASVRSTIELLITGSTRGLGAAAAEARAMAERIAAAEDRV